MPGTDYDMATYKGAFAKVADKFFNKDEPNSEDDCEEYDVENEISEGEPLDPAPFGDPVAVQVVNDKPTVVVLRGSIAWTGEKVIVNGAAPQLIVGRNNFRRSVTIVNNGLLGIALNGATNVRYGGLGVMGSFELAPGASLVLNTKAEVWAIADPNSTGEEVNIAQVADNG